MFCRQCGQQLVDEAVACPQCGVATGYFPHAVAQGRSRTTFILFGILLVSVMSCWLLWLPMYIWTIVEVCTVTEDSDGKPLY